jgi:hypothetical protein
MIMLSSKNANRLATFYVGKMLISPEYRKFVKNVAVTRSEIMGAVLWTCTLTALSPNDEELIFSGSDEKFRLSVKKSASEFYEAVACWNRSIDWRTTRSGMACHTSKILARRNAYLELIERDAFLAHLFDPNLSSTILPTVLTPSLEFEILVAQLQSFDPEIICVVAALKHEKDSQWTIGLGSASLIEQAQAKAVQECLMVFNNWTFNYLIDLHKTSTRAETLATHFNSSLKQNVNEALESIFSGGGGKKFEQFCDLEQCTTIAEFEISKKLHYAHLSHPQMIKLRFGSLWENQRDEIQEILRSRGLNYSDWIIHPMI